MTGEVETPCATCGGVKHEGGTFHPDTESFLKGLDCPDCGVETPCATCGGTRVVPNNDDDPDDPSFHDLDCPDCGVETPEAAAVLRNALREAVSLLEGWASWWASDRVAATLELADAGGVRGSPSTEAFLAFVAESNLIAQGWTPSGGAE